MHGLHGVMERADGASLSVFAAALLLALLVDIVLGEPPSRWHPVVWMGRYLDWVGNCFAPSCAVPRCASNRRIFAWGAFWWCLGAGVVIIVAAALQAWLLQAPWWIAVIGLGFLLKPLLAWAMLRDEVLAVEVALAESLAAGRERLSRLCSRDVNELSAEQVRETAIETLAENLNDSVVAPVFWFVLFGLPGAALYRFANTADAMWGYVGARAGRDWTWAGKWAARADDVLSWVPARLTAMLLTLCAGGLSLKLLRREAARTPSPNSGWPMAAMALTLGVHLGKPGVYRLNPQGDSPQAADTHRAAAVASRTVLLMLVLSCASMQLSRGGA
jgi:adenosylcobinamide-phosphate synthase